MLLMFFCFKPQSGDVTKSCELGESTSDCVQGLQEAVLVERDGPPLGQDARQENCRAGRRPSQAEQSQCEHASRRVLSVERRGRQSLVHYSELPGWPTRRRL